MVMLDQPPMGHAGSLGRPIHRGGLCVSPQSLPLQLGNLPLA